MYFIWFDMIEESLQQTLSVLLTIILDSVLLCLPASDRNTQPANAPTAARNSPGSDWQQACSPADIAQGHIPQDTEERLQNLHLSSAVFMIFSRPDISHATSQHGHLMPIHKAAP